MQKESNKLTTLSLTEDEAKLFLKFREHQDDFTILLDNGIFDMKGGSITVHYNHLGQVRKIETNKIAFIASTIIIPLA